MTDLVFFFAEFVGIFAAVWRWTCVSDLILSDFARF